MVHFIEAIGFPKPALEQEGEEVGEGVELSVESDVPVAELNAILDIGISAVGHLLQGGSGVVVGFHVDRNERFNVSFPFHSCK